jgi:hypothetical protein
MEYEPGTTTQPFRKKKKKYDTRFFCVDQTGVLHSTAPRGLEKKNNTWRFWEKKRKKKKKWLVQDATIFA